jgi:hypothetical protein
LLGLLGATAPAAGLTRAAVTMVERDRELGGADQGRQHHGRVMLGAPARAVLAVMHGLG